MSDQELIQALREHAEWARANEWETPITLGDDLVAAADRLANQNTHILALQKEIAGLREALRWVHDGLYLCDPEKNTVCKKSGCKKQCFHTTFPEFAGIPLRATVTAFFTVPKSTSKKKAATMDGTPHIKRPDADNVAKAILDALNGHAYNDDSAIAALSVRKYQTTGASRVEVIIEEEK